MKVLVTGVSDGIGGAICRAFAAEAEMRGTELSLVVTSSGRRPLPPDLLEALDRPGIRMQHLTGDLVDPESSTRIAAQAVDFCGGLDALISNAGGMASAPLATLSLDNWNRMFDVNVRPTFLLAQALYPALVESSGAIVAIASMSGLFPHRPHGAYSASKAALIMLCRQLAQEWASDGIRSNVIAPGMIRTGIVGHVYANDAVRSRREAMVPLGRIGTPEDIADLSVFLASSKAAYLTGQVVVADGGLTDSLLGSIPGLPTN